MKTLFLSIAFIALLTLASFAQLEKGTWIGGVSGNVAFSFKPSDTKFFSLNLNPYALYLVSKNFAVGLNLDYTLDFVKYSSAFQAGSEPAKYSSNNLLFAPVVRKYFCSSKYRPYVGIATGLEIYQPISFAAPDWDVTKSTDFGFFLNPEAGISYWLNEKVFFDLKASYALINSGRLEDYHTVDLKIGIGVKLGNSSAEK